MIVLKISDRFRNRRVFFFNDFTLDLQHNAVASSFSLSFYFDPNNSEHKELACVAHYHEMTLEYNGELVITGYVLSNTFQHAAEKEMATISGYARPGFLEDCNIPPDIYPLQSDGMTFRQISKKILDKFKLQMVVDPAVNERMDRVYKTSTAGPTQRVKDYLFEMASQKDVVISHDAQGRVVFTESKTKQAPVMEFDFSAAETLPSGLSISAYRAIPGTSCRLEFDGQAMHSHITVMKQADVDGGNAGQHTIRNPYVFTVYRPSVITASSGDDIDVGLAAKRELSNELRALRLVITTDRWLATDGKLLKNNCIISVIDPEVYLYKKSLWFVESVQFTGNQESTTATINCVLPEVYSTATPVYLFKNINLHA